jgi:hypothetical protein
MSAHHNAFLHQEVDAGFETPCHQPLRRDGKPFHLNVEGYVRFPRTENGKRVWRAAHRVRFEAATGHTPEVLDHLCRNRWCCNPEHLEAVSPAVNVRRGVVAKVTSAEVELIRVMHTEGRTQASLALEFGLSPSHVSRIVHGLYWSAGACKHWEQRKGGTQNL